MAKYEKPQPQREIADARGTILTLSPQGLGIVQLENSEQLFMFTFDKIPRYRGESVKEIEEKGIRSGVSVIFTAVGKRIKEFRVITGNAAHSGLPVAYTL